jgi:beta-fructofuranosidase
MSTAAASLPKGDGRSSIFSSLLTLDPWNFFQGANKDTKTSKLADQTTEESNSLQVAQDFFYQRWRPGFHVMPQQYWANDPCGPGYSCGYYHLSFQWNPKDWIWNNMSWGHAISRDMVHWQVIPQPSMQPSGDDDPGGVFTGCTWSTNPQGKVDESITCLYTSAQRLPINWTLPYHRGCELLRMATSNDHGRTWNRSPIHSLVPGPPEGLDVTAWRDPFIGQWDSLDKCLGRISGQYLYGVIAGGHRGLSPTVFLYSIDAMDLTRWEFVCTLLKPGIQFSQSQRLPDFGSNWEVSNFMTLHDNLNRPHDVLVMSVEGGLRRGPQAPSQYHSPETQRRTTKPNRSDHVQNWLCGRIVSHEDDTSSLGNIEKSSNTKVGMEFQFGGCLDFGCYYAGNSFHDPVTNQRIIHGWVQEEDLPDSLVAKQKWSGLLALPRVLGMQCIQSVVAAIQSDLHTLDWINCSQEADETWTVTALTCSPDPRLSTLRQRDRRVASPLSVLSGNMENRPLLLLEARHIEAQASFAVSKSSERTGIIIYHSAGKFSENT